MKKRLLLILVAICLLFAITPAVSAAEVEVLDVLDPLLWRNYYIADLKEGGGRDFDCEIPEGGAAVLIFFGPDCLNSQALFASLNECGWVDNPYVVFSANNIVNTTNEAVLAMVQEKALNVYDYIDVYYARSSWMAYDYATAVGMEFKTMPLVVVLTGSGYDRTIRYVAEKQTDASVIYDVLCAVSPSFVEYEAKKESGELESHVHSYSDWQYTVEPTCTEAGEEARICECGVRYTRVVEAFGHASNSGTITSLPTQTESGEVVIVCSRCAQEETVELPMLVNAATQSGNLNTEKPTKQQLREAWMAVSNAETYFVQEPAVTAPYAAGQLTDELLASGLSYLNLVRYAANLPSVQLSDSYNVSAQHGAVVLAANDELDHYPTQPEGMDDEFYALGYDATSSSNLHMSYGHGLGSNPLRFAVQSFMDDGGANNMMDLGHRRWLLNPSLLNVGFGYAQSVSGYEYVATEVLDTSGKGVEYDFVSWPASGDFPVELFSYDAAWSITLNPRKYRTPAEEDLVITMTRESDGKTWLFNAATGEPEAPDTPHLTVSAASTGVGNCIIFAPGSENIGDYRGYYSITVSGLTTRGGDPASLCYEVNFFEASSECLEHSYTAETVTPTCKNLGYILYTCELCGDIYMANNAPIADHQFTTSVIEATCEKGGCTEAVCGTCNLVRSSDFTDPLGHDLTSQEVTPTCEEQGYTLTQCSRCDVEQKENYVDALGHSYANGVCTNCGVSEPTEPTESTQPEDPTQPTAPEVEDDVLVISGEYSISDQIIDSDVYITATGRVVMENVVVNGDVYCYGQLDANELYAEYVYGYAFGSMYVCDTFDGTHGYITGSLSCYDLIIADDALDYAFETWGDGGDVPTVPMENPFTDIGENDKNKPYYYEPVLWAVSRGITTGMTATTFGPEKTCTRGQIVTFIWRAAGEPEPTSGSNPFKDVKSSDYFYKAVLWAVENGITNGLSANSFGPNESCTRAQVCTFLWRAQGKPVPQNSSSPFSDVTGDYYYDAVLWAVENEVTNGMGGGKFAPGANCTRGQIVTFLYRAIA